MKNDTICIMELKLPKGVSEEEYLIDLATAECFLSEKTIKICCPINNKTLDELRELGFTVQGYLLWEDDNDLYTSYTNNYKSTATGMYMSPTNSYNLNSNKLTLHYEISYKYR